MRWIRNRAGRLVVACLFALFSLSSLADQVTPSDRVESRLRVRESTMTDSRIVGYLKPGESVQLVGSVPYWYEIELPNGVRGFVSKTWSRIVVDATAELLRVGAWNIKKLGHGSAKDMNLVATIIEGNFDVLAIIEVMQRQGGHPGYDALVAALGSGWTGIVTDHPRPNTNSGSAEFYAVLYRSPDIALCPGITTLTYYPDDDGTGNDPDVFSREPAFTCLRTADGRFDFGMAAYHARWAEGDADEIVGEVKEISHVFEAMSEKFANERDLVIVGDFNLVPDDLTLAAGMESRITGTGSTQNTTGERTQNLYDHLLVHDAAATGELIGNGEVLDVRSMANTNQRFYKTVSDHLPIRALFRVDRPDDD